MKPRTILGAVALSAAFLAPEARAASEVSPTGKGTTGCALLGAEAVMITEGILGVKPWWAYAIGGGVGAIGGGLFGGYYTEGGDPKIPFYLFMGGMALVIPTTIVVLNATKWQPVNYTEDQPPADEPVAEPAAPEPAPSEPHSSAPRPGDSRTAARGGKGLSSGEHPFRHPHRQKGVEAQARPPRLPPALLDLDSTDGRLSVSVPAVEVRHMYTPTEMALFHVRQGAMVTVPVVSVVF